MCGTQAHDFATETAQMCNSRQESLTEQHVSVSEDILGPDQHVRSIVKTLLTLPVLRTPHLPVTVTLGSILTLQTSLVGATVHWSQVPQVTSTKQLAHVEAINLSNGMPSWLGAI